MRAERAERIDRKVQLVLDRTRGRLPADVVDRAADRMIPDISADGPLRNSTWSRLAVSITRVVSLATPIEIPL